VSERTFDRTVHKQVNKLLTDLISKYDEEDKDFEAKETLALRTFLYRQFHGNCIWVKETDNDISVFMKEYKR
jgi:hypothetical protein